MDVRVDVRVFVPLLRRGPTIADALRVPFTGLSLLAPRFIVGWPSSRTVSDVSAPRKAAAQELPPVSPMVTTTPAAGRQIMNSVVHFEFPAVDKQRIAKFYQDGFGAKT